MEVRFQLTRFALEELLDNALADITADDFEGLLVGAHVGLFTAHEGLSEETLIGGLTAATYTGYARQPVVWGNPGLSPLGRAQVHGEGLLFSPTDSAVQNVLAGAFLADALAAGNLLGYAVFDPQVTFSGPQHDMTIVPVFAVPKNVQDWGKLAVIL